ncbi:hypothetical protein Lal_00033783 [Lupinus albus]|uniref:Putative F-box domain, galactose oxidase/kelch, beta-propeller, kelch-type beta propeller n=1 Tax=Lupinus albus TaxID=3870 RepID=A0A6A4QLL3_LUPAL|nr:putative F-box domain, galactose oxidase/kelch, beta-propeller, kelch-type beta propeller [Lupinus albus]KAF1872129.1 hypothetical protein Lal_00033783 [Lupinus albus]
MATTKHEKVSINIPYDLIFNILSKLPIKSLRRFSCVTPSWANLLENPNFMMMYTHNFFRDNDHDTSIFLRQGMVEPYDDNSFLLCGERFENKVKLYLPHAIQDDEFKCRFKLGSIINGTICLYNELQFGEDEIVQKVVLWNLSSNEFKIIPPDVHCPPGFFLQVYFSGFGFVKLTNDYKLIRKLNFVIIGNWDGVIEDYPVSSWQLYSLKSNSWKELDFEMPSNLSNDEIYFNGMCHWWGRKIFDEEELVLVSFNLSDEVFYTTQVDTTKCYLLFTRALVVINDSIATIVMHEDENCYDISILGEIGVKESWTKIITIGPIPCISYPIGSIPCISYPIGVWIRGKIFFRESITKEIFWFDLSVRLI